MATLTQLIDDILAGPAVLRKAVAGMTREQLLARPVPGKWSTLEVVAHLADFDPILADRANASSPWTTRHWSAPTRTASPPPWPTTTAIWMKSWRSSSAHARSWSASSASNPTRRCNAPAFTASAGR